RGTALPALAVRPERPGPPRARVGGGGAGARPTAAGEDQLVRPPESVPGRTPADRPAEGRGARAGARRGVGDRPALGGRHPATAARTPTAAAVPRAGPG